MPRQHLGDEPRLVRRQAILCEQVPDFGLRLAGAFLDLAHLAGDPRLEELTLALAADVLPGGHGEDARQGGGRAGDEDREGGESRAGHGGHHGEDRHEPVLGTEDDLSDVTQPGDAPTLLREVGGQPVLRVSVGRAVGGGPRPFDHPSPPLLGAAGAAPHRATIPVRPRAVAQPKATVWLVRYPAGGARSMGP